MQITSYMTWILWFSFTTCHLCSSYSHVTCIKCMKWPRVLYECGRQVTLKTTVNLMTFILPPAIYVRETVMTSDIIFGVYEASELAARALWAWHASHDVHDMSWFSDYHLPFMFGRQSRQATPYLVYMKASELATRALWARHANRDVHEMSWFSYRHFVSYVCHTVMSRNNKFNVYEARDMAMSATRTRHVNYVVHDIDRIIFISPSVIYVCYSHFTQYRIRYFST